MTLGIYFDTSRASHFFAGEDRDPDTLTHEAVHQFFPEFIKSARNVGGLSNAWIIEGIACYFESLTPAELAEGLQVFTVGEPSKGRLPAAYSRAMVDGNYVPLEELCQLGTTDLQRRSDIAPTFTSCIRPRLKLVRSRTASA